VKRICEAIIRDEKSVLPVSSLINGLYGINDVTLSLPAIIGKDGVEDLVPIRLSAEEHKKLSDSAEIIKGVIRDVL
ncbi:MAG: hypothetical protein IJR35_06315, partial [Synergistaceae bacterium]|nr:hypothetical protein [Synergistaceae bacterium]